MAAPETGTSDGHQRLLPPKSCLLRIKRLSQSVILTAQAGGPLSGLRSSCNRPYRYPYWSTQGECNHGYDNGFTDRGS